MTTEFNYNHHVVVAHDEWKLRCPSTQASVVEQSEYLGGFEWRVTLTPQKALSLVCEEFKDRIVSGGFHLELFIYGRLNNISEDYKLVTALNSQNPSRTAFRQTSSFFALTLKCHSFSYQLPSNCEFLALNVRILKDRPLFHDFTVDKPIASSHNNDLKLKVGEQVFHVNKQLLEPISPYFNRMFNNSNFVEASQKTIETGETDVALFHDFLLTIIPSASSKYTVLPNSKNLAGLMRLAQYYGVDSLSEKFEHALKFCREMPVADRLLLAKKYVDKKFDMGSILHGVNSPKELKRICATLFKADE